MNTQTLEAAKLERLLYRVAWSMLSNSDDRADAVQKRRCGPGKAATRFGNSPFPAMDTRIMVNTCNTMLRKRLNQRWVPLE